MARKRTRQRVDHEELEAIFAAGEETRAREREAESFARFLARYDRDPVSHEASPSPGAYENPSGSTLRRKRVRSYTAARGGKQVTVRSYLRQPKARRGAR